MKAEMVTLVVVAVTVAIVQKDKEEDVNNKILRRKEEMKAIKEEMEVVQGMVLIMEMKLKGATTLGC